MSTTHITVQGWVGSDVESTITSGGNNVATFRLGSTPQRQDRDGVWQSGETAWYTVRVWRQVAEQVNASIHKGEPVVVSGRLVVERWERQDGSIATRHVLDATALGHDLTKGRSAFMRATSGSGGSRRPSSEREVTVADVLAVVPGGAVEEAAAADGSPGEELQAPAA
ncbi:MAG TPA: single-stranded DNA-binding protein [Nocardioides sp.]